MGFKTLKNVILGKLHIFKNILSVVMKIKKLALSVAILGAFAANAHANNVKPLLVDQEVKTGEAKIKCPVHKKVMPVPPEHKPHPGSCMHHKKHTITENYNTKIVSAAVVNKELVVPENTAAVKSGPEYPRTGSKIIPYEEHKLAKVDTSIPAIDLAQKQYDAFFTEASIRLRHTYSPVRYGQYSLPTDIATIKVGRVKSGVMSNFGLFGKKDKLSIYLFQHKPAMRLYGWYEQRMIAWHNGKAPMGVTVERAINHEAKHNFLDTALVSNETTLDMLKYFDGRLGARDSDILRTWLVKHKDHAQSSTLIDILASGAAQQKTDSLYLR